METEVATQLYRIVQESTCDVARHARATLLKIAVQFADSKLHLVIADDGIGLKGSPRTSDREVGLGLRIMRYRAERVGATFHIERNLPQGTVIRVSSFLRA
jgi:signal transduction histidine kinase